MLDWERLEAVKNKTIRTVDTLSCTMIPRRTAYVGPFVHSKSLHDLEICQEGIIGVDELGKIAFIERSGSDAAAAAKKHGWDSYDVVRITDNGFFFPGFVGKAQRFTSSP